MSHVFQSLSLAATRVCVCEQNIFLFMYKSKRSSNEWFSFYIWCVVTWAYFQNFTLVSKKYVFVYCTVQSIGLLKVHFTTSCRPVYSNNASTSLNNNHYQPGYNFCVIQSHISTTAYSQMLIYTAERTEALLIEQNCPVFETVARTWALSIVSLEFYSWDTMLNIISKSLANNYKNIKRGKIKCVIFCSGDVLSLC